MVWKECGLDVGHWTEQNEEWFKARLASIRAGKAKPVGQNKWRSNLKYDRTYTQRALSELAKYTIAAF